MPYTYEKDKNGRWRTSGRAAGGELMPTTGGAGFAPSKPTAKRRDKPAEHPWWWHVTPAGLANDLKYEDKRAQRFNAQPPTPTQRAVSRGANSGFMHPLLQLTPLGQIMRSQVGRQVVAGATVRALSDAGLAGVNLAQKAAANYGAIKNPLVKSLVGAAPLLTLPVLGLFGPARDPEATPAGKAIVAARRAGTVALGARLPEEMKPADNLYEEVPAGWATNVALGFVPGLQVGSAIKGAGVLAKAARWGLNTAANETAANLVTDNTMGGPSGLLKAAGVPVPDALSADPRRDDRIGAAVREIPAAIAFAFPLGGAAALFERAPHIARAIRDNRTAGQLRNARQKTVANGLQEVDPATGEHSFTQTAQTAPPKPAGSPLEQSAAVLGITPEELAARRGMPAPAAAPAPEPAAPAAPKPVPSIEGDFTTFGKAQPGELPRANTAVDPWKDDPAYQDWLRQNSSNTIVPVKPGDAAPAGPLTLQPLPPRDELRGEGLADPWGLGPDPSSPVQQALGAKAGMTPEPAAPKPQTDEAGEPVYDPELPEIDHVALALEQLDPDVVDQIVQTPGPVLPRIEEALASRQPVAPRPELTAADVTAPTEKLAENQFLTRRDEWANLRNDELLGVFHPDVNPGLFDAIHARTGRSFEELTRDDALETLSALADQGGTVMPDRLKAGVELARTADLVADPERFQYKLNTDKKGVQKGNSLEGVGRWNTSMENALLVWEDPATGKTYVVNGHNRLAKALELGIPTLPVKRLLANTPEQARALGAMDNIASGGGTSWDAAKFFRDAGIKDMDQADKAGLPLRSGHAEKGLQLAALPDNIFQAGLTGELPEARALALGASGLSPEKMQSVWKEYQEDKFFRTEENFNDLIAFARDTPTTKTQTGRAVQGALPGLETAAERDLTKAKLKLAQKVAGNLKTDKNALRGAARNAPTLEGKGNSKIDANASMQAGLETAQLADVFDALKFKADNEISRLLNEGAAEIAAGAKADMVARRIQGELAKAAESVMLPAKAPEPAAPAPVAPEPPMPKTAQDHEANQMLVLNRAAAQGEVRPSATPIPVPPAPPEIDVAKAAKGIDAQDVMGGDSQLKFAQQQRQQALDAGDTKAVEAWDKEIRKVNQGRLGAAMDAQDASQTGLFGVTEYDNSMPLFDQSKLDAEEARLAAEYKERDTAMQQEVARAEREAMGYHNMTFDQKKAEAGIAEGWAPAELPETAPRGDSVSPMLAPKANGRAASRERNQLIKTAVKLLDSDLPFEERSRILESSLAKRRAGKPGIDSLGGVFTLGKEGALNKIEQDVIDFVDKMTGGGRSAGKEKVPLSIEVADHVYLRDAPRGYGIDEPDVFRVEGAMLDNVYTDAKALLLIARSDVSKPDGIANMAETGAHEAVHWLQQRRMTQAQLEDLASDEAISWFQKEAAKSYDDYKKITNTELMAWGSQRIVAARLLDDMAALYRKKGQKKAASLLEASRSVYLGEYGKVPTRVAEALQPIVELFERFKNYMVGAGFKLNKELSGDELKILADMAIGVWDDTADLFGDASGRFFAKLIYPDGVEAPPPAAVKDFLESAYRGEIGKQMLLRPGKMSDKSRVGYDMRWALLNDTPGVLASQNFQALSVALRQVDGGKLKGVSKKALDAAEKGDPELALAEATDYASRRMAEIDNKIEGIKQRAIEEGC